MIEGTEFAWEAVEAAEVYVDWLVSAAVNFAVLLPFLYYWYLYRYPSRWVTRCGPNVDPSVRMAQVSSLLKLLQIAAVASQSVWRTPPWYCLAAIITGQFLNLRVYQLLGTTGVYYGSRFGAAPRVPWVTAFPFSVVKHPQYVGAILTLLGCLCWAPWPYVAVWAGGYLAMMAIEDDEPRPSQPNGPEPGVSAVAGNGPGRQKAS